MRYTSPLYAAAMFSGLMAFYVPFAGLVLDGIKTARAPLVVATPTPAPAPTCQSTGKTLCTRAHTKSYQIKGIRYKPQKHIEYKAIGIASHYGVRDKFHGKPTATGETFDAYAMTAAHKTLPLPCYVKVTNLDNGLSVILKVNDRGPFHKQRVNGCLVDREIDVSDAAAKKLGFYKNGTARVQVETLPAASIRLQNHGITLQNS